MRAAPRLQIICPSFWSKCKVAQTESWFHSAYAIFISEENKCNEQHEIFLYKAYIIHVALLGLHVEMDCCKFATDTWGSKETDFFQM
jgi:hypothetical protein